MRGPRISVRLSGLMSPWRWFTCKSLLRSWVVLVVLLLELGAPVVVAAAAESAATPTGPAGSGGPLSWLLSDKGPFHHSQEFVDFTERYQQGFTTKYKIYR